jgi:hypothetical protein
MGGMLNNMLKGLILHYLHQRSVEEAIEQGRAAGVPEELLESLPGMMFCVTSVAGAILREELPFDKAVDELMDMVLISGNEEDFSREDAVTLVKLTVNFIV